MEDAIAQIAAGLVALLGAIITGVIVPWIRTKTTREQRELAYGIVISAVGYAEQTGLLDGLTGTQKKERAKDWIHRRFQKLGIAFDDDEVEGWIEDVVDQLGTAVGDLFEVKVEETSDR